MDKLWWLSSVGFAVVLSLFGSLAAAYLKPKIDDRLSQVSTWWATRTEKQRLERDLRIAKLKGNTSEQILQAISSVRYSLRTVIMLLFTFMAILVVLMYLSQRGDQIHVSIAVPIMLAFLFGMIWALRNYSKGVEEILEVWHARKLEAKVGEDPKPDPDGDA